jgi:hypothetical protein
LKNIYDKIEKIYTKQESDEPAWVGEFRAELKEIKILLKNRPSPKKKKRKTKAYFEFVNVLRERLKADKVNRVYPELEYKGKRIGVNFKGFLYDKATTNSLSANEAFAVYEYFYDKKEQINSFIMLD